MLTVAPVVLLSRMRQEGLEDGSRRPRCRAPQDGLPSSRCVITSGDSPHKAEVLRRPSDNIGLTCLFNPAGHEGLRHQKVETASSPKPSMASSHPLSRQSFVNVLLLKPPQARRLYRTKCPLRKALIERLLLPCRALPYKPFESLFTWTSAGSILAPSQCDCLAASALRLALMTQCGQLSTPDNCAWLRSTTDMSTSNPAPGVGGTAQDGGLSTAGKLMLLSAWDRR
jgi:hypothetical protein